MENEVVKKHYSVRFIAIVLCACLLIGSALAITPTITKVSMPDPYGVMPLALAETPERRLYRTNGTITYGAAKPTTERVSVAFTSKPFDEASNVVLGTIDSPSSDCVGTYIYVDAGTTLDYVATGLDFSVSSYQSLVISGSFLFALMCSADSLPSYAYPDTAQLLVNMTPVGNIFSCEDGSATVFTDQEISLTEDVYSVGVRFVFNDEFTASRYTGGAGYPYTLYANVTDSLTVVPVEVEVLPYEAFFERVIGWQQSTHKVVTDIGSELDPDVDGSVGSYIKESAEDTSDIASIFAREDDIKLRDDMDSTLKEATSSFWSPAGEGETETEFDKATKVDKQKVTDIKNVGEGAAALFDTGYGITDGFEAIATDDSFMSWFTAETANALDSTGQAVAVGDDDPYNMHFYYDQMQAIQKARGDD